MSARYASYLNAFFSLLYCHIIFFCPKLGGWRPCPVWQILDPPLLTNIFTLTECCVFLPPILHKPPSGGFRILLGGGGGHQFRKWGNFANFLPKNAWKWKNLDPRGRPWRTLGSANATDAYLGNYKCDWLAMLAARRSAGVALEENLRNPLCAGDEVHKRGNPLWLWDPNQTSPEVQNRVISGPTRRTHILQIIWNWIRHQVSWMKWRHNMALHLARRLHRNCHFS